jgi:hypothetical protein
MVVAELSAWLLRAVTLSVLIAALVWVLELELALVVLAAAALLKLADAEWLVMPFAGTADSRQARMRRVGRGRLRIIISIS